MMVSFENSISTDNSSLNFSKILTESVAYEFGANRGLIQYQFPPGNQPDTEEDNVALGLITSKTDAVLLRIESANTQDYFELEIVRIPFFIILSYMN
jgi:neurexin